MNLQERIVSRVSLALDAELARQKAGGKKFITDQQIDDLIDKIMKEELEPNKVLYLIGTLNTPFGLNGYSVAQVGHPVYERNDGRNRYFILLNDKLEVPFYKETLKPIIDFIVLQ